MGLFNWLFRKMCYRIFSLVDVDKSGYVESMEVEVAIYRLYNIINKRIPGWSDPPSRKDILAAMKAFDSDGDLRLNRDEFVIFARSLTKNGPDMFFARVGKDAAVNTALLPIATKSLQAGAGAAGWGRIASAPLHVAAPAVGTLFKAVRAILPIGL